MNVFPFFPLNMAAWTYGGIALLLFAIKNFNTHQESGNFLNLHFAKFMLFVGISLTLYAGAPLLTDNSSILVVTMSSADSLIMLSMLFQSKVCLTLGLFKKSLYYAVNVGIVGVSILSLYLGLNFTVIKTDPLVTSHIMHPLSGLLQSIVFVSVLIPVGLFFLKSGLSQKTTITRFKIAGFGMSYLLACIVSVINYGFLKGQDSLISALMVWVTFTILLLIVIVPSKTSSTVFQDVYDKPR